jgi:hypothetical protein
MKIFLSFLLIAALGACLYFFVLNEEPSPIEIEENLIVSKSSDNDISSAGLSGFYTAKLFGTVKNIGTVDLKDIVIEYNIGGKNSLAKISLLEKGEQLYFTSKEVITKDSEPSYKMNNINFRKGDL